MSEYDYRYPETPEEVENFKAKISVATSEQKRLFARFMAGDYEWAEFQADNGFKTLVELGYWISTRPAIESIIAAYSDFGIIAEHVKGRAWHNESMVAVTHDGIQYGLDDYGRYVTDKDKNSIEHAIKHFKLLSTHYHERVNDIHNHLISKTDEPIWVLAGGGYQIQASFGNKNGYIATLDLDINSFVKVGVENSQRAKAISNKKYEISMNANNFNDFFSDFKLNDFIVKVQ
jgi:hypothetical protein